MRKAWTVRLAFIFPIVLGASVFYSPAPLFAGNIDDSGSSNSPSESPAPDETPFFRFLEQLQTEPNALDQTLDAIQKRIEALESQKRNEDAGISGKLDQKQKQLDSISGRIDALIGELERLRTEIHALGKDISSLHEDVERSKPATSQPQVSLPVLERAIEFLQAIESPSKDARDNAPAESPSTADDTTDETASADLFANRVQPILDKNCFECHSAERQKGGLRLDSIEAVLRGSDFGPVVTPGKPEESLLISAVEHSGDVKMPPDGKLDEDAIGTLIQWVRTLRSAVQAQSKQTDASGDASFAIDSKVLQAANEGEEVNFSREILPVLSGNCFACHGPDANARKANLRLDTQEGITSVLPTGNQAVVPGHPEESVLLYRITAEHPADRMPPDSIEKDQTDDERVLLARWIAQGAPWGKHWAFEPPVLPEPPEVTNEAWPRNPIDHFVLKQLEDRDLTPSKEADKRMLIRRVTLDLTGLPPTPDEVAAFLRDDSPNAYERVVDRLLASPQYGEHMARYWLDVARYADTNGYHIDNERFMWRWRDWVIQAFNENKPFDEFTIEQLAGDQLEDPTLEQRVATGFNRNHMINFEGGIIEEEYRVQYVADRVDTTATAFMGLTMECAQCHDHKYDPISQREYYEMFAFFNTIPEKGSDGRYGNADPKVDAPLPEQQARLDELDASIENTIREMQAPMPQLDEAQQTWEQKQQAAVESRWTAIAPESVSASNGASLRVLEDGSILAEGKNAKAETYEVTMNSPVDQITGLRIEAIPDGSLPNGGSGRAENGNFVLSELELELASASNPEESTRIPLVIANCSYAQADLGIEQAIDGDEKTGWGVNGYEQANGPIVAVAAPGSVIIVEDGGQLRLRLRHVSENASHNLGRFRVAVTDDPTALPSELGPWYESGPYRATEDTSPYKAVFPPEKGVDLDAAYEDGRQKWTLAEPPYIDGKDHPLPGEHSAHYLFRTITAASARTMQIDLGNSQALKVWLNGEEVYAHEGEQPSDHMPQTLQLREGENRLLLKCANVAEDYSFHFARTDEQLGPLPAGVEAALAVPEPERTEHHRTTLLEYYRSRHWDEWQELEIRLAEYREERAAIEEEVPTTMVMAEMEDPRETFILKRGQYDQTSEKVEAGTPEVLPALDTGDRSTRLDLARWLVDSENPLTARVVINRYWQRIFGTGIVKTVEDFGVQGEFPSHPELLDWLATEFIDSGWDIKHMLRLIVTSATYRQSSKTRPELEEIDPNNRLLARGARFRMDAEVVRDNALAVSGLLVEKIGGPSVKPYQPKGLWKAVAYGAGYSAQVFEQDEGDALYRRSMYSFWKRTSPPPNMLLFDAPNRETCIARRERTNTPLQALALLNDPQYVEAARKLAERMITEAGPEPRACVERGFLLATARPPTDEEAQVLLDLYRRNLEKYKDDGEAAAKFLSVGDSGYPSALDEAQLAAWSTVASVILNLHETITKS